MFRPALVRTESGTGLVKPIIVVFTKRAPFPAPNTAIPNNSNNNNNSSSSSSSITSSAVA